MMGGMLSSAENVRRCSCRLREGDDVVVPNVFDTVTLVFARGVRPCASRPRSWFGPVATPAGGTPLAISACRPTPGSRPRLGLRIKRGEGSGQKVEYERECGCSLPLPSLSPSPSHGESGGSTRGQPCPVTGERCMVHGVSVTGCSCGCRRGRGPSGREGTERGERGGHGEFGLGEKCGCSRLDSAVAVSTLCSVERSASKSGAGSRSESRQVHGAGGGAAATSARAVGGHSSRAGGAGGEEGPGDGYRLDGDVPFADGVRTSCSCSCS